MHARNLVESIKGWITAHQLNQSTRNNPAVESCLLMALAILVMLEPTMAFAGDEPWLDVAAKIKGILQGGLVTSIATIGVVALGIMALAGKLAWDTAIKVIIGITLIFGATKLVTFFSTAAGLAAA